MDPAWVIEEAQKRGIRARVKPAGSAPTSKLEFTPSDLVNFVMVNEARESQGLEGIDGGDIPIATFVAQGEAQGAPANDNLAGLDLTALGADPKLRAVARARGWRLRKARPAQGRKAA